MASENEAPLCPPLTLKATVELGAVAVQPTCRTAHAIEFGKERDQALVRMEQTDWSSAGAAPYPWIH